MGDASSRMVTGALGGAFIQLSGLGFHISGMMLDYVRNMCGIDVGFMWDYITMITMVRVQYIWDNMWDNSLMCDLLWVFIVRGVNACWMLRTQHPQVLHRTCFCHQVPGGVLDGRRWAVT